MRSASYALRRVRQTFSFANGPRVLADLATTKTPWRRDELVFRTRDGTSIACPNTAGARLAVYEHFIEDAYHLDELSAGLASDFVVLDVGAQIGAFALAVTAAHPGARVHAYEASPTTAAWLTRNVEANGVSDRVHVHPVAIADHEGTLEFADLGEASVHNGITAPSGSTTITVPCTTMAQAFADAGGRVDVLKMDAEGAEYSSILNSPPELWAEVQRVVMEYHPVPGYSWSDLEKHFADAGLDVVRNTPEGRPGLGLAWLSRKD